MQLQDYLYTSNTVSDVLDRYIKDLNTSGEMQSIVHANKLIAYQNIIADKQFLSESRKLFNETFDFIYQEHPELQFSIAGRIKSLVSTEKKILQYSALEKSLDFIRDFFAFRIILFGNDSIDLISHCYKVMEEIIEFAAKKGFNPCESLPLIGANDLENPQNTYYDSFKYKQFIKDYICFPKENDYQSLHLVLVDTKGRYIEIQIRTLEMHAQSEVGKAKHRKYKNEKYNVPFPIEREKISIHGYTLLNNQVFDYAGVENPIMIFQRQKTF